MSQPQPFKIDVADSKLNDIKRRVSAFPWHAFRSPRTPDDQKWAYGPPQEYMKSLCQYWVTKYEWSARQAQMNSLSRWKVEIHSLRIHFVHERGSGRGNLPVLLLHGWPYSFHSFHEMIPRLAHPERYGGKAEDGVDVIAPSMPGYDFSDAPSEILGPRATALLFNELMVDTLGYDKYIAHGGDWGSYLAERLGFDCSEHCVGIHLTMVSVRRHGAAPKADETPEDADTKEREFVQDETRRWLPESAYARLQSNKPSKLGFAMADSPVGVAAWIIEAWHAWSDLSSGRRFEDLYSFDDLLDEVMLYLVTDAFHTSTWIYVGEAEEKSNTLPPGKRIEVPVGILAFPDPVFPIPPRDVLERSHNVVVYDKVDHGGHFPFYEARDELVDNLQKFCARLR